MNITTDRQSLNDVIVVKLWEIYLLYHPANLYKLLTDNSLDNGPQPDKQLDGRVVFRFSSRVWESDIKQILYEYRIPVSLQSDRMNSVKVKGRAPVLR